MSEINLNTQKNGDFLDNFLSFEDLEKDNIINDGVDDKNIDIINTPPADDELPADVVDDKDELKITNELPDDIQDDTGNNDNNDDDLNDGQYSYKALLSHLNEEGLIDFEDSDDLEDKPELIFETVKNTIEKGIESYKESIPEVGKQFLEYLEKGGDPNKYIESLQKPFDLNSIDLESERDQEKVVTEYLKTLDYTKEEIEETLEGYKDGLLLEKQAKLASSKLAKVFEKRQEQLLREQEAIAEQQREEYSKYINTINNSIETANEIAGLEISKKEKDDFRRYLLAVDKDGMTQYQRELQENPVQTQLELAYLKYKKYDFANAKKAGAKETTNKLKSIFKNNETTVKAGRSSEQVEEQLGNLDAFKRFAPKRK